MRLDRILLITDITAGVIIYQFGSSTLAGTVASNVLTLTYNTNTSAFSNSDALMIIYDSSSTDPTYDSYPVTLDSLLAGEDLTNNVLGTQVKPIVGSQYAPGTYQMPSSPVLAANIKSAAGNVYAVRVTNADSSPRYLQLFNSTSAPSGGATAQLSFLIPSAVDTPGVLQLGTDFFTPSEYFTTGISFAISTTDHTYTASATASEHTLTVRYE